jgi:predicted Zn-dependent protease
MSRAASLLFVCTALTLAQQPQEPPEEDLTLTEKKVYVFNPLQAEKELKVGNFYFKKGSYRAASQRFLEATKWDANFAEAFRRLGESEEKQRNAKTAREAYAKYLELAPGAKDAAQVRRKLNSLASAR